MQHLALHPRPSPTPISLLSDIRPSWLLGESQCGVSDFDRMPGVPAREFGKTSSIGGGVGVETFWSVLVDVRRQKASEIMVNDALDA